MARSAEDEAYEEAVWRAWQAGINPDRVSRERIQDTISDYADPWDCGNAEVRRLRRWAPRDD